jgi:hypothetical protein
MCRRARCEQCQKLTFTGCGKHLDVVFRGVPESDRCRCAEAKRAPSAALALFASSVAA